MEILDQTLIIKSQYDSLLTFHKVFHRVSIIFHMMLLKSDFKLKISQHISQGRILCHFLYQKDIFISLQGVSHGKLSSHGFHMLFTWFSQGIS